MTPAILIAATLFTSVAAAAPSRREIQARQEFAAARYANALEIFAELYAQTLHPTYLRNIGRCHQEMGEPDKAITSFRQYLAKAQGLKASEREEVNGFIRDMEELKRRREQEAAARPASPPPPPPSLAARNPDPAPPPPMVAARPAPEEQPTPVYGRWWFWAAVGGALVAGGAALWASGALGGKDARCPSGAVCQ
jgi:hypothetical protein